MLGLRSTAVELSMVDESSEPEQLPGLSLWVESTTDPDVTSVLSRRVP